MPGRAGDLQDAGASAALVAELGDNYAKYHEFLVAEFDKLGGFPDPPTDPWKMPRYLATSAKIDALASSEVALRQFRAARLKVKPEDSVGGVWPGPLLDGTGRPTSAEDLMKPSNTSMGP